MIDKHPVAVIGYANEELMRRARWHHEQGRTVVVLTSDRDLLQLPQEVETLEWEDLTPNGSGTLGPSWDRAVARWLTSIFGDEAWAQRMMVNAQMQPEWKERLLSAIACHGFFSRYRPANVETVGRIPPHFSTIPEESSRRGIPTSGALRRAISRAVALPAAILGMAVRATGHSARFAARVRGRGRAPRRLAALGHSGTGSPRIWFALSPSWYQSSRHVIESLILPLDGDGAEYGLVFTATFGEASYASERNSDERSLLDGTLARVRPIAVDQATGVTDWMAAFTVWRRWLSLLPGIVVRAARHARDMQVDGMSASLADDWRPLVRVACSDLLRALDAEAAAADFVSRHEPASLVVFSHAPPAEVRVVDELLQRSGVETVDYAHGYASEFNLRTHWRSISTYHLSWTQQEGRQFASLRTNRECLGGFMPRFAAATGRVHRRKRLLVATNYLVPWWIVDGHVLQLKHARRLARITEALIVHFGDEFDVVLRPHPHEDRALWESLFTVRRPLMSERKTFLEDVADADILVTTKTSAALEALTARSPYFFTARFPWSPGRSSTRSRRSAGFRRATNWCGASRSTSEPPTPRSRRTSSSNASASRSVRPIRSRSSSA